MMATGQSSRIVSVGSAAGVRCARFFLYFAEFLCWNAATFFFHMRSLRHYNGRLIKTKKVMLCFPTRLVPGLMFWLSALFIANNAHAALGDTVAEYSFPASSLVMSSTRPIIERIPYE
jgi:hypothetical protein